VKARHLGALRLADIARLTTSIAKVRPFILTRDWTPGRLTESPDLRARLVRPPKQQELFA
jgi:predicted DNA-binding helix-hairpin-helix protein